VKGQVSIYTQVFASIASKHTNQSRRRRCIDAVGAAQEQYLTVEFKCNFISTAPAVMSDVLCILILKYIAEI